jgi:hypothetical protein
LSYHFWKEAKNDEKIAGRIANQKIILIDQELLKAFSIASVEIFKNVFAFLQKQGMVRENIPQSIGTEVLETLMKMSREEIKKKVETISLPPEIKNLMEIPRENRDYLIELLSLESKLRDIPRIFSEFVDKITRAIICGVACALLILLVDAALSAGIIETTSIVTILGLYLTIALGAYYFYYGIYQVWPLRRMEKKLENIEKSENIKDLKANILSTI